MQLGYVRYGLQLAEVMQRSRASFVHVRLSDNNAMVYSLLMWVHRSVESSTKRETNGTLQTALTRNGNIP